jgi:hypothetical protein
MRSRRLLALMMTVAAMLTAWVSLGPVSNAGAITYGQYCWGVGVPAWGECNATYIRPLVAVFGKGGQHAACTNAYEWGLVGPWACAGKNEWASISFNGSRQLFGTVKNNTASSNVLYGEMWW